MDESSGNEMNRAINQFKSNSPFTQKSNVETPSPWASKSNASDVDVYREKLRKEHQLNMKYDPDYARMFGGMKEGY